jgi:hypothetical protein
MSTLTTIVRTRYLYTYRTDQRYYNTSRLHVIGKRTVHDKVFAGGATLAESLTKARLNVTLCVLSPWIAMQELRWEDD